MGMLWMGDGRSHGRYCRGYSERLPTREFPVLPDYHKCQCQITTWGESADVRRPVCWSSRCVSLLVRNFEIKMGATHPSSCTVWRSGEA